MNPGLIGVLLPAALLTACRPSGPQRTAAREDSPAPAAAVSTEASRADSLLSRADRARIRGDTSAPVWIVELSDFECPYCKQWHDETYPVLVRDYVTPGHVRLAFVNFPLQQHPHAFDAAEAAMCAAAQDRFWPMHDGLFRTQPRWSKLDDSAAAVVFDSLAVASGANRDEWRDCMQSGIMRRLVDADRGRGTSAGVRSTPTFFVGDEAIQGAAPIAEFRAAIERARAKAAGARPVTSAPSPPPPPPSPPR